MSQILLKKISKLVILGAIAGSMQLAFAARQCLALPGTYGAVTVTGCEADPANGIFNPVSTVLGPDYPYDGVALGPNPGSPIACTYGFSHSIATSSITIDVDFINPLDKFYVELDGQPYTFIPADIVQTPLPASTRQELIAVVDGTVQNAPSTTASSGTVMIGSNVPARISSLKLNMDSNGAGGVTRVCVDDSAEVLLPIVANDEVTVSRTQPTAINVISNDEAGVTVDSTYPLTLSDTAAGTLAYSGGQIQFTPASGFTAPVTFQYQACNAASVCATATVTLTPQAVVPSAPTPVPGLRAIGLLALTPMIGLAGLAGSFKRRRQ